VFDPQANWVVEPANLLSQGHHTPFGGYELPARVRATLVGAQLVYGS
jgi:dihydroorotase